ncbi:MAG: winged helix DNA-binding domain-containing protein [Bacillota bacterium]
MRSISGVQAQVAAAACLALRARVNGLAPEDVEGHLWVERKLVKTWCMRATLHYLPASDLPWYLAGICPSIALKEHRWMAKDGLERPLLDRMVDAVVEVLSDGPLTRREIGYRVVARIGEEARPWVEHSWGGVIKQACLRGLVCFGPERGREVTFAQLDQWIPGVKRLSEREGAYARARVLENYLRGYGPATIQDFSFWSGVPVSDAAEARQDLGERVVGVSIAGAEALVLREDVETLVSMDEPEHAANLLPSFDPFLLGHRDKTLLLDSEHYKKVYRKAGWISPVMLVGGRIAGTWNYTRSGKRLVVEFEPFGALGLHERRAEEERLEQEAGDVGRLLGFEEIQVRWSSTAVRAGCVTY